MVLTSRLERRIVGASWLLRIVVVIEVLQVGDASLIDAVLQVLLPRLFRFISVGGEHESVMEIKDEAATVGINLECCTYSLSGLDEGRDGPLYVGLGSAVLSEVKIRIACCTLSGCLLRNL